MKQADNRYDMEQGRNRGDAGDVYFGPTRSQLTPSTSPNTNTYQAGNVRNTNVFITSISTSQATMTFRCALRNSMIGNSVAAVDAVKNRHFIENFMTNNHPQRSKHSHAA
jgi:hypothetical protein